ncbi:hypothetical protein [Deinococcus radiophilus]|uniref:Uncharacterized protein n=1 Tax=Deinococcus radiophilus TaxID=32062 RepID=A0A3S0KFW4_9DEIO|nr:hypothetical protein [Deinococcus radiophilus]RTR25798.1 hypothetical protein EJ104_09600 [Deinococcus radiophilus]UFA50843.1 hypothetical protein LMT64_02750 [Deinococcus radiophilus]
MSPKTWRTAALVALGLQVLAFFWVTGYVLGKDGLNPLLQGLDAGHNFFSGVLTVWWALLLARLTLGRGVAGGEYLDRVRQTLRLSFPLLTAFRTVMWGLTLVAVISGVVQAHPVALTAILTITGANIVAGYMVFFWMVRWADKGPHEGSAARAQLTDWLNVSAALALGVLATNVLPVVGFSDDLTRTDQLVYGLAGLSDVVATLLALGAVRQSGELEDHKAPAED